ncbi:MAG: pyridoxamine 5'-phosphate oxidase family protein [Rhodobacteraceae bacterium]|nr:pyridoxamine 5'-phosphate oxidase family protein [Paracoccaceae bacterium]
MTPYQPTDRVTSAEQVRAVLPKDFASQTGKVIDHVDDYVRLWIERSPFVAVGTFDRAGRADVAPKGDPAGFVKVLDRHTLAIPDRPGNHRFDTFQNILETGRIALMFMVPNRNEVVRVNGRAEIVRDAPLRAAMAVNGRVPDFAILVRVEEAFYHCGKAVLRARLWQPGEAAPVDGLPSYGAALKRHAAMEEPVEVIEGWMRGNELNRMYDE